MRIRTFAIPAILFIMAVVQTSFLNHFNFFNRAWLQVGNLVAVFVFVYVLLERRRERLSWLAAAWAGILLDLYSNAYFGIWTVSFLILVFMIKIILRRYVSIPSFW